ncbi:MAG: hypothetical protein WC799_20345 [Desulfobacteraceae bacterium]|jgi:hypothetical protein
MDGSTEKNIKFMGNQIKRNDALSFVDAVLKEKGRLGENIDFAAGLSDLVDAYMIHIIDDDDSFAVKLEPYDEKMNALEFTIDKESRTIYRSMDDQAQQTRDDENIDFLDEI